jgi:hypothetical protein
LLVTPLVCGTPATLTLSPVIVKVAICGESVVSVGAMTLICVPVIVWEVYPTQETFRVYGN